MGPDEKMDVESLQKLGARRGRCLDRCLVVSVIVLFAAVVALAAAGALIVHSLQSQLQDKRAQPAHPEFRVSKVIGDAPDNTFKMQNFAYLEAISSELKNHTMPLAEILYLNGNSVGGNFEFNSEQHSLQVKQEGSYFMYVELNLTCGIHCGSGVLTVHLSDKLNCKVQLPNSHDSQPVHRRCWTVTHLSPDTHLLAQMSLPHGPLDRWKLELQGSGVGLFLVS